MTAARENTVQDRVLNAALLILLPFGCYLAIHPYLGIMHDGVHYLMRVQAAATPAPYAGELFLDAGDRQNFSLFVPYLSFLLRFLDLPDAAAVAGLSGMILWFAGLYALIRTLFGEASPAIRFAALLLAAAMHPDYRGHDLFFVVESYAAPRMIAEALTLSGLAFLLRGRVLSGASFLSVSALFHPLIAAGPLLSGWIILILQGGRQRRISIAAGLAVLALAALLAFFRIPPFDALRQTLSGDWLRLVLWRDDYLFLASTPDARDLSLIFGGFITLALGVLKLRGRIKTLCAAVLAASVLCLALALLAEASRNLFGIQMQFWRILWLLKPVSALSAIALLQTLKPAQDGSATACWTPVLALLLLWLSQDLGAFGLPFLACSALLLFARPRLLPGFQLAVLAVMVAGLVLFWLAAAGLMASKNPSLQPAFILIGGCLLVPLLSFAATLLPWSSRPILARAILAITTAIALAGVLFWYAPAREEALYRKNAPALAAFRDHIPEGASVYWGEAPRLVWFGLRRPLWLSRYHGAPLSFSEDYARRYQARLKILEPWLAGVPSGSSSWQSMNWSLDASRFRQGLEALCRAKDGPGFVIAPYFLQGMAAAGIRLDVPEYSSRYWLYACGEIRAVTSD